MITTVKGTRDILPPDSFVWNRVEAVAREVFHGFGYGEIRTPLMEPTELFTRGIGEDTDIVNKEMYTFPDKKGRSLTLRPEGTAPVARAYISNGMHALPHPLRLYYIGPMFRYERPQKGRYRQFHQIGAEVTGVTSPRVDAQVLVMLCHFFTELGLTEPTLQINSLGCPACRPAYRNSLKEFLRSRLDSLCDDCRRRIETNPLRALDCKAAGCGEATREAPSVLDHLCPGCDDHFSAVRRHLETAGTPYAINSRMVRGLDYYTRTTFELVTGLLGSQSAVAAGGRYDGLIEELGGPNLPGIGFAMGVERVALLLSGEGLTRRPDLFIAAHGEAAGDEAFRLMILLQRQGFRVEIDYEGKSLKSQMRRADKFNARFTLIIGENELVTGSGILKAMDTGAQEETRLEANHLTGALLCS